VALYIDERVPHVGNDNRQSIATIGGPFCGIGDAPRLGRSARRVGRPEVWSGLDRGPAIRPPSRARGREGGARTPSLTRSNPTPCGSWSGLRSPSPSTGGCSGREAAGVVGCGLNPKLTLGRSASGHVCLTSSQTRRRTPHREYASGSARAAAHLSRVMPSRPPSLRPCGGRARLAGVASGVSRLLAGPRSFGTTPMRRCRLRHCRATQSHVREEQGAAVTGDIFCPNRSF
jgi:hypothetical protein